MLVIVETRSLKELKECDPLSCKERCYRIDFLEDVRYELNQRRRLGVWIGEYPEVDVKFYFDSEEIPEETEREFERLRSLLGIDDLDCSEPWKGWITLEPQELEIQNAADLANLFKLAMQRSELGPGQLSTKTGIHRSQIYLLTNTERGSVLRNIYQLRRFLRACRVAPKHRETVITQWAALRRNRTHSTSPIGTSDQTDAG